MYLHSSPKETQLFWSCRCFGEECRSVNFGPNFICAFPLVHMTRGHWLWSRVTKKNLEIKVAFLLGKSVCVISPYIKGAIMLNPIEKVKSSILHMNSDWNHCYLLVLYFSIPNASLPEVPFPCLSKSAKFRHGPSIWQILDLEHTSHVNRIHKRHGTYPRAVLC